MTTRSPTLILLHRIALVSTSSKSLKLWHIEQITNDIENYRLKASFANENEKQISLSMLKTFYAWIDVKSSVHSHWCMMWINDEENFSRKQLRFLLFSLFFTHSLTHSMIDDKREKMFWWREKELLDFLGNQFLKRQMSLLRCDVVEKSFWLKRKIGRMAWIA
jgi:hypothetical protein